MQRLTILFLLISAIFSPAISFFCPQKNKNSHMTLTQLTNACLAQEECSRDFSPPVVSWQEFEHALEQAAQCMNDKHQSSSWLGAKPTKIDLNSPIEFKPFVQKISVSEDNKVLLFGDLHGSVHGLMRTLDQLKQHGVINDHFEITNNTRMLFLGDYVDRGTYGVEVTYTLLRLKQANPDQVFFARGNHEDIQVNATSFSHELEAKFSGKNYQKLYRFYDLLPVAIYLGTGKKYLQCCHGGMEIGYNPQELLASRKSEFQAIASYNRPENIQKLSQKLQVAIHNCIPYACHAIDQEPTTFNTGFMWNDFIVDEGQTLVDHTPGRGWVYGKNLTAAVLDQTKSTEAQVCGVFRAHQHSGLMLERMNKNGGKASLWDGLVETLFSAPAMYGKTGEKAACWQLTLANNWKLEKIA